MITITTSGSSIIFEFDDNQHYLQNGTIEVPVNSLLLVTDSSNMATFKKAATNDIFLSALYSELGMTKEELIAFYEENMVGSTGGGGGINSGTVQTMIDESISGKADTSAVTDSINAAVSGKQDTLSAGTNITIVDNVISAEGGGKAIEAGRGISITTGETADTVSLNLSISAGTLDYSIQEGYRTSAMSYYDHAEGYNTLANGNAYAAHAEGYNTSAMTTSCHAEGRNTKANGNCAHAEGSSTVASGDSSHAEGSSTVASGKYSHAEGFGTSASSVSNVSGIGTYAGHQARHAEGFNTLANNSSTHAEGYYTIANNFGEHASGVYNNSTSATTTWGDSGNTLFSVGNGTSTSARHNAFEIRQNGDIYCSDGTNDVKLQDTITATAANTTALGGLSIVKLTESEYTALVTKDSNTLYVVVPDSSN